MFLIRNTFENRIVCAASATYTVCHEHNSNRGCYENIVAFLILQNIHFQLSINFEHVNKLSLNQLLVLFFGK